MMSRSLASGLDFSLQVELSNIFALGIASTRTSVDTKTVCNCVPISITTHLSPHSSSSQQNAHNECMGSACWHWASHRQRLALPPCPGAEVVQGGVLRGRQMLRLTCGTRPREPMRQPMGWRNSARGAGASRNPLKALPIRSNFHAKMLPCCEARVILPRRPRYDDPG